MQEKDALDLSALLAQPSHENIVSDAMIAEKVEKWFKIHMNQI